MQGESCERACEKESMKCAFNLNDLPIGKQMLQALIETNKLMEGISESKYWYSNVQPWLGYMALNDILSYFLFD